MRLVILATIVSLVAGNLPDDALAAMDRNNDGIIDESEYPGGAQLPAGTWPIMVCAVDQNGDGKMQLDEFKVMMSKAQDQSFLQEATVRCASTVQQPQQGQQQQQPQQGQQQQQHQEQQQPSFGGDEQLINIALAQVDKNRNGFLDKSEYPSPLEAGQWEAMVCGVDKNGDGKIGLDEFKTIFSKITQGDMSFIQELGATCGSHVQLQGQQQKGQQQQGQQQQEQTPAGGSNSVSINMILFTMASLMVIIWK